MKGVRMMGKHAPSMQMGSYGDYQNIICGIMSDSDMTDSQKEKALNAVLRSAHQKSYRLGLRVSQYAHAQLAQERLHR